MQRIIPTIWTDDTAEDAVNFYEQVFGAVPTRTDYYTEAGRDQHGHNPGEVVTIEFEIEGFRMIALNGGSIFTPNPSVSFTLTRDSIESVDALWQQLSGDGSKELMPLDAYPFSERYGWIQDKFGVSWQIMLSGDGTQTPPTPSLLFVGDQAGNAEAAMEFYASIFPDSTAPELSRYPAGSDPDKEGTVSYGEQLLFGQKLIAMDSAAD
ncbi:MAG: VOC family protein [Chloroflexi bacterium]|nr:MAG: VOC family protein [Chloroflexota bacterium]